MVIPVLGDLQALRTLLRELEPQAPAEVIVVSGRADAETAAVCHSYGWVYAESTANRGAQLHTGATLTHAPVLWFLHADAMPPPDALDTIRSTLTDGIESGCFRFRFQGPSTWYKRLLEALVALRIRFGGMVYGDQGIFATREAYFACGGFGLQPLFEEVTLVKKLRARRTFRVLPRGLPVATRRWERDGWCRRTLHNRWLALRFMLGASPDTLAASYRRLVPSEKEHER